jgi:hypothetical protein
MIDHGLPSRSAGLCCSFQMSRRSNHHQQERSSSQDTALNERCPACAKACRYACVKSEGFFSFASVASLVIRQWRSSWLMLARNCDLRSLASASCLLPAGDRTTIRPDRMLFHVLLLLRGEAVAGDMMVGAVLGEPEGSPVRAAKVRRRLDQSVEHCLQIEGRAADDLEHVGGGGLLLQRFAQFVEQPRVFDGDDGLGGEVLNQPDLLLGEGGRPPGDRSRWRRLVYLP